jgi:hypothetical protein
MRTTLVGTLMELRWRCRSSTGPTHDSGVTVLMEHLVHLKEMVCAALTAAGSVRGKRSRRSASLPECDATRSSI